MEVGEEKDMSQFFTTLLGLQRHLLETLTTQGQQQAAAIASLLTELSNKIDSSSASVRLILPSLTDEDDTVTYLALFERAALAAGLPKQQWASALALQLTGEAEVAFHAVEAEGDVEYQVLKAAVLDRGPLAEESFRAKFRSPSCNAGLGPRGLARELEKAARGWLKPHKRSGTEVLQCVVVEQFTAMLPDRTAEWVRAGRPTDLEEAVKLAESHISLTGAALDLETPVGGSGGSIWGRKYPGGTGIVASEMGQTSFQRRSPDISKRKEVQATSSEMGRSRIQTERSAPMKDQMNSVKCSVADLGFDPETHLGEPVWKTERIAEMKTEESDSYDPITHACSPTTTDDQQGTAPFAPARACHSQSPSSLLEDEGLQGELGSRDAGLERTGTGEGLLLWPNGEPSCNTTPDQRGQQLQDASGGRRYICGECGRTFSRSTNLRRHQRIHSGEKPYVCLVCGHTFRTSTALKRHRSVHMGAKLYKCPDCSKSFTYAERMTHHRTAHAALRPHHCPVCRKSFRLKKQLRKHERTHQENGAESPPHLGGVSWTMGRGHQGNGAGSQEESNVFNQVPFSAYQGL